MFPVILYDVFSTFHTHPSCNLYCVCISTRLPLCRLSQFHSRGCVHAEVQTDSRQEKSLVSYELVEMVRFPFVGALVWIQSGVGECAKTPLSLAERCTISCNELIRSSVVFHVFENTYLMLIHSLSVPLVSDRRADKHIRPPTCLLNDDCFCSYGTSTFYSHNNAGGQLLHNLFCMGI